MMEVNSQRDIKLCIDQLELDLEEREARLLKLKMVRYNQSTDIWALASGRTQTLLHQRKEGNYVPHHPHQR